MSASGPVVRGVNLGGWLLLEKWMTPSLFDGTPARDEHGLSAWLTTRPGDDRLDRHRAGFVTEADFAWLAEHGITSVRLPVGHWVFGDEPPYAGAIEHVDDAFAWAQTYGISVLLGLHGAPGSQNGLDHSGRIGPTLWHTDVVHADSSVAVIERLARRYGAHPALLGIELLNEPSGRIPYRWLRRYYERAYAIVRQHCGPDVWVVFNPYVTPWRWWWSLRPPRYTGVIADVHVYQCFSAVDKRLDVRGHVRKITGPVRRRLRRTGGRHPVVVGEWSVALDPRSLRRLDPDGETAALRRYGDAQLDVYEQTAGWFYWSYRTESGGAWSFRDCVETGLLTLADRRS